MKQIRVKDISEGKISSEQAEALQKYFKGGGTWQQLLELSDPEVEQIYATGYDYYVNRQYEEALASFTALIQLNPYQPKHWIAVGAALQGKKSYEDAIAAYELALSLDENHAPALFYSAQCAWKLGEKESCKNFLERVLNLRPDVDEREMPFAEKAEKLLEALEKKEM